MTDLKPGDEIVCLYGNAKVRNVFKMPTFKEHSLVKFDSDSICPGVPNSPLTLTSEHEIMYPNGGDGPCKVIQNGTSILMSEHPVKFLYHVHIDRPGQIHYAKVNGGIWADVWGNDNRLVGAMMNAQYHK